MASGFIIGLVAIQQGSRYFCGMDFWVQVIRGTKSRRCWRRLDTLFLRLTCGAMVTPINLPGWRATTRGPWRRSFANWFGYWDLARGNRWYWWDMTWVGRR